MGDMEVELYWKHAPETCRNFAELSRRGYYNGVIFHRIITDFMVQGGDPTGTGEITYLDSYSLAHSRMCRKRYDLHGLFYVLL